MERWRRFGKDRLYVTDGEGRALGWCDLIGGVVTVDDDQHRPAVAAAVEAWRTGDLPGPVEPSVRAPARAEARPRLPHVTTEETAAPAPARMTEVGGDPWEDLALRRPGQAAREQATALRQAAPVRTFVTRLLRLHTDERAWRIGADGEEKVAAQLARLVKKDPRWRVLHAVPVGKNGADIDHVVIGPAGVFTLNTKHHPGAKVWIAGGTFMVNGRKLPYLRNSRHEAARASKLLTAASGVTVEAKGVVVPVGVRSMSIRSAPEGAGAVHRRRLVSWLRRQPGVVDQTSVDRLFDAARRSTTWQP